MKELIIIMSILVAVVCANRNLPEETKKYFQECREEVGMPKRRGHSNLEDPQKKCFIACIMKKNGKMENGKLVPEKIIEFHKKMSLIFNDDVKEKLTECIEKGNKEEGECEVAAAMARCIFESTEGLEYYRKLHKNLI